MPDNLAEYINSSLSQGIAKPTIEANLLKSGWVKEQIDKAFQGFQKPSNAQTVGPVPPWKSPTTTSEAYQETSEQGLPTQLPAADYVKRVLAGMIDLSIIIIISQGLRVFLVNTLELYEFYSFLWIIVFVIYFISFTGILGQTPGKKIFGLKVISPTGTKINWYQVLVRESIGKFVSFAIFNLGFIWIFINSKGRGWHDQLAKTIVIETESILTQKVTNWSNKGLLVFSIISLLIAISRLSQFIPLVADFYYFIFLILWYPLVLIKVAAPPFYGGEPDIAWYAPIFWVPLGFLSNIWVFSENLLSQFMMASSSLMPNIIGFVLYDFFPAVNIKIIETLRKISSPIIIIPALYPLALYWSRRNRSWIVVLFLIHMLFALIWSSSEAFNSVNLRQVAEKKAAIGPASEKQESLEKLCFKVYVPTYTNPNLREPQVRGYDRLKPCENQYVFVRYERISDKSQEVAIKENKNTHPSLVAINEDAETKNIGGYEVKIIERKSPNLSSLEFIYRLIIDETRIELTWSKSSKSILSKSEIEKIIASLSESNFE